MPPRPSSALRFAATLLLALGTAARAQTTATTDPVGFVNISLPADSDTFVNVPFKRAPEYAGLVATLTKNGVYDQGEPFVDANANGVYDAGESFTDTFNTITVADTPGWAASQFVYASPSQPKHYYVFVASDAKVGTFFTVVANTANSVTLDLAGDTINSAVVANTKVQVIPYDTLGSVFPGGAGIIGSATHAAGSRQTEILIPDQQSTGINLSNSAAYYYYTGTNPGWRKAGDINTIADNDVLYPDSFFIVRMKAGQSSNVTVMGVVQMASLQTSLNLFAANTSQDNAVALPIASSLTLRQSNLFESGAFAGSGSHAAGSRQDVLLVIDNAVIGHNKSASKSYYYYTGTVSPGAGWRLAGDINTVRDDSDYAITPTTAIIVRKKSTGSSGSSFWLVKPPYVP